MSHEPIELPTNWPDEPLQMPADPTAPASANPQQFRIAITHTDGRTVSENLQVNSLSEAWERAANLVTALSHTHDVRSVAVLQAFDEI